MSAHALETVHDLKELGTQIAVAYRNSDRSRSAATEFYKWQNEGPSSIGPLARDSDTEKRFAAIQLLGELRTERAVPYLEESLKAGPSEGDMMQTQTDLFDTTLTALFRTESYDGHKIIRTVWSSQHSGWPTQHFSIIAESFQGLTSNLSWWIWSKFKCSYPNSIKSSDEGVDYFNRQAYASALMAFSDAVKVYPYYAGYWRQMGDTKVRMANEGKRSDYDTFRNWWKSKDGDKELKERLKWGGVNDLNAARALAPFLAGDLVDIGYGIAMAEEFEQAISCYDQALSLYSGETTKAYTHFRRAEAREKADEAERALSDYEESKRLYEEALDRQRTGREIYGGLPYRLEDMVADITQRIQRLGTK